ncbi:PAS domain-containing protein [Roseivivax sp. CAU 1761]
MNDIPTLPERIRSYLDTARVPIAVSATEGDTPLIFVNDRFCDLTGYSKEEVIGRNRRFLQGSDTKSDTRDDLHAFVHDPDHDSGCFPVLNYRNDGGCGIHRGKRGSSSPHSST